MSTKVIIIILGLLGNLPKSPKRFILVYISYTIIIDTILIFLSNFHRDNTHLLFHELYDKPVWINAPELLKSIYHNEKSMVAFSYSTNEIVIIFGVVLFLTILIETIVIFGLNFKVLETIRGMNIKLHDRVKLIQQTLYRIIYQKTIILMLFFFAPFLVVFLCILSVFSSFYVILAGFALMPLYAPCSYILIICNVKSYRGFLCSVYERLIGKRIGEKKNSTVSYITVFSYSSKKKIITV